MSHENTCRIVIADDHVLIRHGIKNILAQEEGLTVTGEVSNGEELLLLLEQQPVDLLILDISMPKLDGYEVIPQVKEKYPETRILVLTVHKSKERLYRVLALGAEGYLIKEDSENDLLVAIRKVMSGKGYLSPSYSESLADNFLHIFRGESHDPLQDITLREREVLQLVVQGKTSKDIADILGVSYRTVDHHRASLLRKFKMKSSIDLVNFAVRNGLAETK